MAYRTSMAVRICRDVRAAVPSSSGSRAFIVLCQGRPVRGEPVVSDSVTLLPRVFCSEAVIATVAEIDIYVLTIESWNDRVLVRTVGVMTETAEAIVTADEEESAAWMRRRRAGADEPPPEPIGGRLARSLTHGRFKIVDLVVRLWLFLVV
jgi:hypothetical protein